MIEEADGGRDLVDVPVEEDYGIRIESMRKAYGRTVAVRDLTMHVPRGSVFGFVGPNGAGKTTTIRTLATLQRADAGLVSLAGIDVHSDPGAVRDRVGYMPDFFGPYDSLSVLKSERREASTQEPAASTEPAEDSTTSRLLAAKKRRR